MFYLLGLLLSLLALSVVKGTIYYISETGNNANSGTSPASAWATPTALAEISLVPGDEVLLKGTIRSNSGVVIDNTQCGTVQNPITISSYGMTNDQASTLTVP